MERLNLSPGRKRVLKLSSFLVLLVISLVPSISFFSASYFLKEQKVSKLLVNYPEVFNNLSTADLKSLDTQVENLLSSLKSKESQLRTVNEGIRSYIIEKYKDTYFLRRFLKYVSSSTNSYFLTGVLYDGQKFYLEFYEYGTETQISTSTVYNDLGRFYKDVNVSLMEQRNLLGDLKYYHYIWEGMK